MDESGYRKEIYPGAVQFMLELARGRTSATPRLVRLLSARPKKLGFLKMKPKSLVAREFQRVAQENGVPEWGIDFEGACSQKSESKSKTTKTQSKIEIRPM